MQPDQQQPTNIYNEPTSAGTPPPQPAAMSHGNTISPINDIELPTSPISQEARERTSQLYPQLDAINQSPPPVISPLPIQSQQAQSVTPVSGPSQAAFNSIEQVPVTNAAPVSNPPVEQLTTQIAAVGSGPDMETKKSKKPLLIGVIIAAVLFVFGSGGAAYALWYANPDKVLVDAVVNGIKSKTMIANGSVLYKDDANKGSVTVDFKSQSDTPKAAGSLDATVKIDYSEFKLDLKGAGMIAETGDLYFRIDNASELFEKALETEYGAYYTQDPSAAPLIAKLRAFIKKIDGQWIKVDKADLADYRKDYDKQQACTKKALDTFYADSKQQQQVIDIYTKNKFIIVKDSGKSETINGQDSVQLGIQFRAKEANAFGEAVVKTDVYKAIEKCGDTSTSDSELYPTTQSDDEIAEMQKSLDKLTTTVWVSRWGHEFTKFQIKGSEGESSFDLMSTLDSKTQPTLKAPAASLKAKDLAAELEAIYNEAVTTPATSGALRALTTQR